MRTLFPIALLVLTACGSFDDPTIVYDMRVLGAIAEPPEILVPADLDAIDPTALPDIEVCALVADPGDSRELSYGMVACPANGEGRCLSGQPQMRLTTDTVADPEESGAPVQICGTLFPTLELAEIIERSVSLDSLSGFGAIDIQVGISVWPAGNNLDEAIFATKQMRFGAALPAERLPNENPTLETIMVSREAIGVRGLEFELPVGRCGDIVAPIVAPDESLGLLPVEPEGVRQDYVVPTLDGEVRGFTETMSYHFYATHGSWSKGQTGGGRDPSGTLPTLNTKWTAPDDLEDIGAGLDVALYIIQRDERGGQSWTQSCVHVQP